MDMKQNIGIVGTVKFELRDKDGNLKLKDEVRNGITNTGFDAIIARLFSTGTSVFSVVGIGDSATAFDPAQTNLLGTSYRRTGVYAHTIGTKVATITVTWGPDEPIVGTVTVREVGLFDNTVGGVMMSRLTRDVITKLTTDTLTIEYVLTLS